MRQQILRDPDGESEKDSFLSDDVSVASGSRRRSRSMDSYSIEIPQTIDESGSDSEDSGPVYDPDATDGDRDVEKEAMDAIDNYFKVWQEQLKKPGEARRVFSTCVGGQVPSTQHRLPQEERKVQDHVRAIENR